MNVLLISSPVDPEQACDNICVCRSLNSEVGLPGTNVRENEANIFQHQYELLDVLAFNFCSGDYRLLVIDSVIALFRTDYSGRGELAERQQALGQFLKRLAALAEEFNVCVMLVSLGDGHTCYTARLTYSRPTKCSRTQEPALCLPVPTVANR